MPTSSGQYRLFVIDAQGNKQWEQTFGAGGDDKLNALLPTADGGYLAGGATGPSITTPGGTPDSTGGVQPGGATGKTGPMITGSGREPGSTGGVGGGTGAVAKDSTDGTPAGASNAQLRGMSDQGAKDPAFKTAYQECMKRRGF